MKLLDTLKKFTKRKTRGVTGFFKQFKVDKLVNELTNNVATKDSKEDMKNALKNDIFKKYIFVDESNDKVTHQKSGVAGLMFKELYEYLKDSKNPKPEWINYNNENEISQASIKNKLKTLYKKTGYVIPITRNKVEKDIENSDQWITSTLYNQKVLDALVKVATRIYDLEHNTTDTEPPVLTNRFKATDNNLKWKEADLSSIKRNNSISIGSERNNTKEKSAIKDTEKPTAKLYRSNSSNTISSNASAPALKRTKSFGANSNGAKIDFTAEKERLAKEAKEKIAGQKRSRSEDSDNIEENTPKKSKTETPFEKLTVEEKNARAKEFGPAPTPPNSSKTTPAPELPPRQATNKQKPNRLPPPPSPSDLEQSIKNIFDSLKFNPAPSPDKEKELNALKDYFAKNANAIAGNIFKMQDPDFKNGWTKYFIDKPFNRTMTYQEFRKTIYYSDNSLFNQMNKAKIAVNGFPKFSRPAMPTPAASKTDAKTPPPPTKKPNLPTRKPPKQSTSTSEIPPASTASAAPPVPTRPQSAPPAPAAPPAPQSKTPANKPQQQKAAVNASVTDAIKRGNIQLNHVERSQSAPLKEFMADTSNESIADTFSRILRSTTPPSNIHSKKSNPQPVSEPPKNEEKKPIKLTNSEIQIPENAPTTIDQAINRAKLLEKIIKNKEISDEKRKEYNNKIIEHIKNYISKIVEPMAKDQELVDLIKKKISSSSINKYITDDDKLSHLDDIINETKNSLLDNPKKVQIEDIISNLETMDKYISTYAHIKSGTEAITRLNKIY